MRKPFPTLLIFGVFAIAGGSAGYFRAQPMLEPGPRFPSSEPKKTEDGPLSYEKMECPGDSEYRRLAASVNLEVPAGIDACTHEHHAKIAKLLAYAAKLKITMPADWAPELQEDLRDPLAYFGRMSRKTGIDLNQTTSIAYNKTNEKSVYLGGIFFDEPPLEALSVLVHEARHSSEHDPGHTECRKGDIPKTSGGCDRELSLDPKKAGAYSYGAAFYAALALYGEGLSDSDRKSLRNLSLATIGTRFNELPELLAQAFDLVAVLDSEGTVSLLHPFLRDPVPLPLTFLRQKEKVARIEFNVRNNGLLLFTSEHRLFTWTEQNGFARLYADEVPENMPIFDAGRMRVGYDDTAYYNFLTADNQLHYIQYKPEARRFELTPYYIYPKNTVVPPLHRFFMALNGRTIFLGKDSVFYLSPRFGNEPAFDPRPELQVPGRRWVHGIGGVTFDSLFGIADDGRTHFGKIGFIPSTDESAHDLETYTLLESSLQPTGGRMGKKIAEGLNFRALLDNEGDLQIEYYGRETRSFWRHDHGKVVDFTLIRSHVASRALLPPQERATFARECGVAKVLHDPWFGVGLGLNRQGELVVGSPFGQPCLSAGPERFRDLKFESVREHRKNMSRPERIGPWDQEPPHSVRATLWVRDQDGNARGLIPYLFK